MQLTTTLRRLLALACLALPLAVAADDWSHKRKVVADTTPEGADIAESFGPLPVLFRLHSGNFQFAEAKPDGTDLRVLGPDGKTPLKFHVEKFDPANEIGALWIAQPKLAGNGKADAFWLQWGNSKAAAATDAKGTYDPAQALVYHFADGPKDATGNGNDGQARGRLDRSAGPVGEAVAMDGGDGIAVPGKPSLRFGGGFTFTAWIKPAEVQSGILFSQAEGKRNLAFGLSGGVLTLVVEGREIKSQAVVQAGSWQHVAVSVGAGKAQFYLNGRPAGTADANLPDIGGDLLLAARYRGELDELALASTARSGAYVRALHASQEADGPLLAFDEEGGGESASYFTILLGAVTVDGWVVIGILGVMGVISFAVMIGKARFVSRTRRGNEVFLGRFQEKADELLTPGSEAAGRLAADTGMAHASLYRIYAVGIREIDRRFQAMVRDGRPTALSAASLDAIRAAMDAGLVRENHRLNSQIVLLTIAISGGPFLGLLGTVVGVMITFAAIAAAGDVNVNSIAPGIAAALVATVAGLGVAIPALFGYNWLASQIKNVSADMQVFADEFLTRAAELHSA
ncbi:MAG: DUF2341 domain-containing protein [Rhodocyclaceae bacterium]|nr:DUF2341 domain-containing protein [Rhodocyclaceae bacterium]